MKPKAERRSCGCRWYEDNEHSLSECSMRHRPLNPYTQEAQAGLPWQERTSQWYLFRLHKDWERDQYEKEFPSPKKPFSWDDLPTRPYVRDDPFYNSWGGPEHRARAAARFQPWMLGGGLDD